MHPVCLRAVGENEHYEALDTEMEQSDEEEEEDEADMTPKQAGLTMEDELVEFEVTQAEEAAEPKAILESIQSELEVVANRRYIYEVYVACEENGPEFRPATNDHEAGSFDKDFIDISDDKIG